MLGGGVEEEEAVPGYMEGGGIFSDMTRVLGFQIGIPRLTMGFCI